jgi:hypothetical protein
MEPLLMMQTALVLLTITAAGGVLMAIIRFAREVNPPSWLAMGHGLLAGSALTLLLYAYFTTGLPALASLALLIFLIAALGGVFLNLRYHVSGTPMPKSLVVGHGLGAVVAYVLLLMAVLQPQ